MRGRLNQLEEEAAATAGVAAPARHQHYENVVLVDDEGDDYDISEHSPFDGGSDDGPDDLETTGRSGAPDDGGVLSSDNWLQLMLCCDDGSASTAQRRRRSRGHATSRRDDGDSDDDGAAPPERLVLAAAVVLRHDGGGGVVTTDDGLVLPHDGSGRCGGLLPDDTNVRCEDPFRRDGSADHGDDGGAAGGVRSDDALRAAWRDTEAHDKLDKLEAQVSRRCCPCFLLSRAFVRFGLVWFRGNAFFFKPRTPKAGDSTSLLSRRAARRAARRQS